LDEWKSKRASTDSKPFQGLKRKLHRLWSGVNDASTDSKPFQGLKQAIHQGVEQGVRASTDSKPFQGLKHTKVPIQIPSKPTQGFNRLKTLSGIETSVERFGGCFWRASTDSKPFQGLKRVI